VTHYLIYRARGHTNGFLCFNTTICKDCPGDGGDCFVPDNYRVYGIEEFGRISGEEQMMQEIYQRGPISCDISVPDSLKEYKEGVFEDASGDMEISHVISVVGWGEENGLNYCVVRKSWGTYWGENGFVRVVRGKNNLNIESNCSWAVPKDTWTEDLRHKTTKEEKKDPNNDTKNTQGGSVPELSFLGKFHSGSCRRSEPGLSPGERISSIPYTLSAENLPEGWDWRNVNGTNFATINKNQHIPIYCGSCWAHGTTSALADRFTILNGANSLPISLSTQVIVNCQPGGGSCNGGNPLDVYEFAYLHGIPDDTCQQYIAHNSEAPLCSSMQICMDCKPPAPMEGKDGKESCHAVKDYRNYLILK